MFLYDNLYDGDDHYYVWKCILSATKWLCSIIIERIFVEVNYEDY